MSLPGRYLLTGIRLLPGRLSMGPVLPFMAVALGQAAGSPVTGDRLASRQRVDEMRPSDDGARVR